ncbi:MAG: heavy-metal-associated domain-containing protein [Deltaproteobacteria bacterium]|nr:heavy-metal-associated domain-containing protein [Deltaproteobacteria bacterium]
MTRITVKGMTCQHCVMAVTRALGEIDGVKDVSVDLDKGEAVFDETKPVDKELIREGLEKEGYQTG